MDSYKVAEVGERQGTVWLSCTHSKEMHEILAQLQQVFPRWRVRPVPAQTSGSGDETGWRLDKCGGSHRYALWRLIRELCARGWEPFAAAYNPPREPFAGPSYMFRKKVQEEPNI